MPSKEVIAVIIDEATKIISAVIQNRHILMPKKPAGVQAEVQILKPTPSDSKVSTACIPCSIGHLGTCSGLLNEALRFARKDGISNDEVIDRVNLCLDELNPMERVDLRPEIIDTLPEDEKMLAHAALTLSRDIRHDLENIKSVEELEHIAATTQSVRMKIGKEWLKKHIESLSQEDRDRIIQKAKELQNAQNTETT